MLCSNYFSGISSSSLFYAKMFDIKTIPPRKVLKLLIILGFIYQLSDLTIEYLKYDHVNQIEISFTLGFIPSITICVKKEHKLFGNYNIPLFNYINNTIICYLKPTELEFGKIYKCFKDNKYVK